MRGDPRPDRRRVDLVADNERCGQRLEDREWIADHPDVGDVRQERALEAPASEEVSIDEKARVVRRPRVRGDPDEPDAVRRVPPYERRGQLVVDVDPRQGRDRAPTSTTSACTRTNWGAPGGPSGDRAAP